TPGRIRQWPAARGAPGSASRWCRVPALTYSIVDALVPKVTCTCPLNMSVIPDATLRHGTCTTFTPAIILNSSPNTCGVLPAPGEDMLSLPGCALAKAMNSGTLLAGTEGFTTMTFGKRTTLA